MKNGRNKLVVPWKDFYVFFVCFVLPVDLVSNIFHYLCTCKVLYFDSLSSTNIFSR